MPKIIKFLIVISGLLGQLSQAQMMVHDTSTFGEMVNQTARMREQIVQFKDMIDVTKEARDAIGITRTELSSFYNKTFGLVGEVNRLVKEAESIPGHIEYLLNEFAEMSECLFDDMNAYTKSETMYKSRYVFEDNSKARHLYNDEDTEAYQLSDGSTAGAYEPLQLMENPCGMEVSYFEDLKRQQIEQKHELIRLSEERLLIQESLEESKKRYEAWAKAPLDSNVTMKEYTANSQAIQLEMLTVLKRIDHNLHGLYKLNIFQVHDPLALKRYSEIERDLKRSQEIPDETDGQPFWYTRRQAEQSGAKNPGFTPIPR